VGYTAKKAPLWFSPFYKPGKKIAKKRDWNEKLEAIVEQAPNWDIGFVVGVPAWIQMCMEMVIKRYIPETYSRNMAQSRFFLPRWCCI